MALGILIPNFYLVAAGGIGTPRISHAMFTIDVEEAKEEAVKVIKELHPRYWLFTLSDSEGKEVISYEAKRPEVTVVESAKRR